MTSWNNQLLRHIWCSVHVPTIHISIRSMQFIGVRMYRCYNMGGFVRIHMTSDALWMKYRMYSLSNVTLVDEIFISFHQTLSWKSSVVFSRPSIVVPAQFHITVISFNVDLVEHVIHSWAGLQLNTVSLTDASNEELSPNDGDGSNCVVPVCNLDCGQFDRVWLQP